MKLLLARFLPHIAGGLVLALLVVFGLWRFEASRVTTVKGERDDALAEIDRLKASVDGKNTTIAALELAVGKWQSLATPAAAMNKAAERTEAAAAQITARAAALTPAEVKDHANPDCAALLALDIARACPGIAAGVRARAAPGGLRRSPSGSASAGRAEGARPPDR